ncbi:MAG: IS607 family transposase [Microcystis aeruginosa G11-06]|nr:IS607 family transposase [Microcystis aeruginosa G11-06]
MWQNEICYTDKSIRTPGGQRRYCLEDYEPESKSIICYARVSTHGQKDDLERQAEFLRSKYPRAEIITEIGSGLNFKRERFLSILERIHQRNVALLAVAYPDRLARFGFPLIEWLCEQCECKLVVLNESKLSPQEELIQDILSILHCFSARFYGLRKYQKQAEKILQEEPTQSLLQGEAQQCLKDQGLSL